MELNAQHHAAINLLVQGKTNKSTAKELGIAHETISRWKADYDFQAEMNRLLSDNQEAAQERLRALSGVALETIEAVMTDKDTPAKDKLTAALKVLELAKVTPERIGYTDPAILEKEDENNKFLESLAL